MRLAHMVEDKLKYNRKYRNSDRELIISILDDMGFGFTQHQKELFKSISVESIRRIRQKLQEQGKYLPDQEIATERRFKAMQMQQNLPKAKTKDIERIIEQPKAVSWLKDEKLL